MSLDVEHCHNYVVGDGTTGPFAFTFLIWEDDDLVVVTRDANGVEATLTLDIDYTVTFVAGTAGGSITMTTALAATSSMYIGSAKQYLQDTEFGASPSVFRSTTINTGLDKLGRLVQQVAETQERSPAFKVTSDSLRNTALPDLVANNIFGVDASGTAIVMRDPASVLTLPSFDYLKNYTNLPTAVSTIGAGNVHLFVTEASTVSSNVSVPANICLHIIQGGRINPAGGVTVSIANIEAGWYQCFGGDGTVTISGTPIKVDWFSTVAKACSAVAASNWVLAFRPNASYTMAATGYIEYSYGLIEGNNAQITISSDIDGIVINNTAIASLGAVADTTLQMLTEIEVRNFRIYNDSGVSTKAGIKWANIRMGKFSRLYIQGFYYGMWALPRDAIKFEMCRFVQNKIELFVPDEFLTICPQLFTIEDCKFSSNPAVVANTVGIKIESKWTDVRIIRCDIAGKAYDYMIQISTGSGLSGSNLIIQSCSFEQSQPGQHIVFIENDNGDRAINIDILNNYFSSEAGASTHLIFQKCSNVMIHGNRFAGDILDTYMTFDADCVAPKIGQNYYGGGTIISYACARSEINFVRSARWWIVSLTGYAGDAFSTSTATVDMSALIGSAWPEENIQPRAWILKVRARDGGSSGGSASVTMKTVSGTAAQYATVLTLDGAPNDTWREVTGLVPPDANGDFYVSMVATGAGTLDVYITLTGYIM